MNAVSSVETGRCPTCEAITSLIGAIRWKGLIWSAAAPMFWVILFYSYVIHVRLALGRWPKFGEQIQNAALTWHWRVTGIIGLGLFYLLFAAAAVFAGCLLFNRWRHRSLYALGYAAAVGLAYGSMHLAPQGFLNWLFD